MITLKNFQIYESKLIGTSSVLYLKDETGADWYESQKSFSDDTMKIVFNSDCVVISMNHDVSKLWPIGNSVAEVDASEVPAGLDIDGGWIFDGKKIIERVYTSSELISQATVKRDSLMAAATAAIAPLQDAVDIDEATDAEIALLKAWKKYRVALSRLDLSTAPDIEWPTPPH